MQVERVELRRIQIPFRRAFGHAAHERHGSDAVLVSLHDERGTTGWGEILPRAYVTGETIDEVLDETAPALGSALLGSSFSSFEAVGEWLEGAASGRKLATLCGFDLALVDLAGQRMGRSGADLLGGVSREALPGGVIVGFEIATETLARYCATLRLGGKRHVKIKVGRDDDHERLRAVARVFKDMPLRLDANAAWTVEETIERLRSWEDVSIASIEQPVAADDHAGMRRVREETGVAVMADESVCTLSDAEQLIASRAADIFNIRLGKNGGLLASRRLVQRARAAGIGVHLGTMVGETGVLSTASALFGRCVDGFACLDGKGQNAFLLERDILEPDLPDETGRDGGHDLFGLGLRVSASAVREVQVGETRRLG
jgi:L-Ala-D/L-Glu epimerase